MAIHAQYNGIEFDLNNDKLGTWDAFEMMTDAQDGDFTAAVRFARLLFGKEQFKRIKAQINSDDALVVLDFINGAIKAAAAAKGENPKN